MYPLSLLIGVDDVAYTYASLNDLLENNAQSRRRASCPIGIHHGFTVSMYYADPDGNQMEFQVDSYGSNEEANAFMEGPHFAANPIGVAWLGAAAKRLAQRCAYSCALVRQSCSPSTLPQFKSRLHRS